MKRISSIITSVSCSLLLCAFVSCGNGSAPKDAIGTDPKQFTEVLGELKSEAGVNDPEYMTIIGSYNYSPTTATRDGSSSMLKVEMVSKADKNEVTSYFLTIPGNKITEQGVSLSIGDKEVASYDEFAFMLFKESDVSNLIGKLSDLFNQVKEKSGYGDNAYIGIWKIERNREGVIMLDVTVNTKESTTSKYKMYKIDADGNIKE